MLELDPYRALPNPGETGILEVRPAAAVIGAGISGLITARILAEHGYPVTVFDKGRRPGGRSSTRYEGDYSFDHGCQYFNTRDRRFQRYVEAWVEQGVVSLWKARRASCRQGVVSLVDDDVARYVGVPGMNAVALHLAKELDVRLGITINGMHPADGRGWQLEGTSPIPETFEIVVSSAPPSQTAAIIGEASPLGMEAAKVPMQPCWTAMATFDYDLEAPFDAAHISASPLVWAANNSSKPGRSAHECWVMQASPSWSIENLEMPPDQVAQSLLEAFFAATGMSPVKPCFLGAHRWRYASPGMSLKAGGLWDDVNGIGMCGDWSHRARMEGAFLSGLELAEKIMNERPRAWRGEGS